MLPLTIFYFYFGHQPTRETRRLKDSKNGSIMLSLCEGCKPIKYPSANKKKPKDEKNDSIPPVVLKVSYVMHLLMKEKKPSY